MQRKEVNMTKKIRNILIDCLESDDDMKKEMAMGLIKKATSGDVRAFVTIAKFIGEFPSEQQKIRTDEEIKKSMFPWQED